MTTRETILRDIRRNLGSTGPPSPPPVRLRIPTIERGRRIESAIERIEALAGRAIRVRSDEEAHDYAAAVIAGRPAVATPAASVWLPDVRVGAPYDSDLVGITTADYVLSDTGSLVMMTEPRLVSLLPPVHIAIVPADRLLTGLDEFYTLHPLPAAMSSSTVFITGPSRTGDIELVLVRGVHGPRELHVAIIGD
jgi:L-lactate utilization protein LutC